MASKRLGALHMRKRPYDLSKRPALVGMFSFVQADMRVVCVLVALLLACSGPPIVSDPGPEPCVKPGATYVESFSSVYGTCPGLPAVLITIPADGTFPVDTNETCKTVKKDECKLENSSCVYLSDGCEIDSSVTATFKDDGTGIGWLTVEAQEGCGRSCMGIYQLYFTKEAK